jgi:S-adenosylmethionine hydrolase
MIVLFTDFGADDVYVAQVKAVLLTHVSSATPVLDLLHSVPSLRVDAAAHLLCALQARFPAGTVFFAVVDPGVGSERAAAVVEADGKWYVGPDNGLLSVIAARASEARTWRIVWRPPALSASFHGRDLFAPIAGHIAAGTLSADAIEPRPLQVTVAAGDLARVIYIDHYGNALSGLRAEGVSRQAALGIHGRRVTYARVFADAPIGEPFWYENSLGLVEIAAPRASAAEMLGIEVGDRVDVPG